MEPCSALLTLAASVAAAPPEQFAIGRAIGTDTLLLVVIALAITALVSLVSVTKARRETRTAARMARSHATRMNEMLRTVRMAESIADIGVWQYDPKRGEQQWSDGMRRLFGLAQADEFLEGDAETLLYANDIDLVGNMRSYQHERDPFTLHYDIHGYDGAPRSISVQACNLFGGDGDVARIVAVVRDVTDQMTRERALEHSRRQAVREADQARKLAETDALTGLANRRRVMAELDRMILTCRSVFRPLTLVIFDIDRFKAVNDLHGHPEGDKVLQRVAAIAQNQSRDGDCMGRIGGEEFVWIVPGANSDQAAALAQRLREAVAQDSAVGEVPAVTISIGLAQLSAQDTSLSVFSRADTALYAAKNAGRNRVEVAV